MKVKVTVCKMCGVPAGSGVGQVVFGVLAATGRADSLCPACRFNVIDGKHSSVRGIRQDMRDSGVPLGYGGGCADDGERF